MKDSELLKRTGESIKSHRMSQKISQKKLAEKAEISVSTLAKVESGISHVKFLTFLKISTVLGVKMDDLTGQ